MKRMVSENLIAILKDLVSKGIAADDIENAVDKHLYKLGIMFVFKYTEGDTIQCKMTVYHNKNTITVNELISIITVGDCFYDEGRDTISMIESINNDRTQIYARYFDSGSWTEYENGMIGNISDITILNSVQLI